MASLRHGRLDLRPLLTHRFQLGDIVEAYDLFGHQRDGQDPGVGRDEGLPVRKRILPHLPAGASLSPPSLQMSFHSFAVTGWTERRELRTSTMSESLGSDLICSSVTGVSDPSRLLLAYGLTRDIPELLELKLPSQVPDIQPRQGPSQPYISKDDV